MPPPAVRPAAGDDLPAIAAVMAAAGEDIAWPGLPGWPYLEHLHARPGARLLVGTEPSGAIVGMGGSIPVRHDTRFVTDLFVDPERQSGGIGRAILDALLDDAPERATFSSADERALAAYIRAGMRPWWPLLYLDLPRDACAPLDPDLVATPVDVATSAGLAVAWSGLDRAPDFEDASTLPDAAGWLIAERTSGQPAAIAWSRRGRTRRGRCIDHATVAPDADPVAATFAILAAGVADAERLLITIPGPHPAVPVLLERGARILDRDTFCASEPGLVDAARILPSPSSL